METKILSMKPRKNRGFVTSPPVGKHTYKVNWKNVAYIERTRDDGCKVVFVGGSFIMVDRKFDEVDKIAAEEWRK